MAGYAVDILAVGFFVLEWSVYAYTPERTSYGRDSLSARMHAYRERWISAACSSAMRAWSTCRS